MQDTVLVVEDEADMVDLLRYHLSKVGFGVLIARDGLTGLEIARKNRPDVVLLDLLLPHMDGYAVCRALKNTAETASFAFGAGHCSRRRASPFAEYADCLPAHVVKSHRLGSR